MVLYAFQMLRLQILEEVNLKDYSLYSLREIRFLKLPDKSIKIKFIVKSILAVKTLASERALEAWFRMKSYLVKCSTNDMKWNIAKNLPKIIYDKS